MVLLASDRQDSLRMKRHFFTVARVAKRIHAHPLGFVLATFAVLLLLSGMVYWLANRSGAVANYVARSRTIVIISHDGKTATIPTTAKTVGDLLEKLHIKLAPGDRVEPESSEEIKQDNLLVNVYRSVPVAVTDGATRTHIKTAAATPRSMAESAGVQLYGEDVVQVGPVSNFVLEKNVGRQVTVDRAKPIALTLYGQLLNIRTQAQTVGELLKEKNVTVRSDDTVKPAISTPLTEHMQVAVVRNGIHVITVTEDIPVPVKHIIDPSLSFGSQAVRQEGSPGKRVQTYEINVQQGEEVSRRLLQSVVTVQPVERIVAKGNTVNIPADKQAVMAAAGIHPNDYAYVDYIFSHESRWNTAAASANGYYGLGQTNLARLSSACPNWQTDAVCQTKLFAGYATGRYGSWQGAYNFWLNHRWW
ncbi:hypothetical protein CSA80_04825 [Candidatus Saccharibacteria bacterium]|nr:MAG: hypothetical protein CSA80_04825 [Candidatus Saccharibacteria bacterium]